MTVTIRQAEADDLPAIVELDFRNFGNVPGPGDVEAAAQVLDVARFLVAVDGNHIVGAGGSFDQELTLPGGGTLPQSGVTWVSVLASHRRRGVLRGLMSGLDELSAGFGEPLLALTASEAGIYERFGYGVATRSRLVDIDRRRARFADWLQPEAVRLIDARDHVEELLALYDRYRLGQVGEVSRSEALFRDLMLTKDRSTMAAIHADGYAIWAVEPSWNNGHPAHVLTVRDLIAVTHEAYVALWHLLLSVDLVGPVRAMRVVSPDDPLPYLLDDPRAVRTVEINDMLWLKVTDIERCFGARTYRTDDRIVLGVVESLAALHDGEGSPPATVAIGDGGATAVDEAPDLVVARSALGPLLLGGISAAELAGGRRLNGSPGAIERADRLLGVAPVPHCRTAF